MEDTSGGAEVRLIRIAFSASCAISMVLWVALVAWRVFGEPHLVAVTVTRWFPTEGVILREGERHQPRTVTVTFTTYDLFGGRLPFWAANVAAAFLPLVWCVRVLNVQLKGVQEMKVGCCDVCGYDLRATPARCPECGFVPKAIGT